MKRNFKYSGKSWALALLAVVIIGVCSCSDTVDESSPVSTESSPVSTEPSPVTVDDSIVQVWDADELAATGVVIGDGSQVLTVLNFEEVVPDNLDVVTGSGNRYSASIEAIDPRTGATLLKIDASGLPVASTGDAASLVSEQPVIARWYEQLYTEDGPGEPTLAKTDLMTHVLTDRAPVNFGVHFPLPPDGLPDIYNIRQGAVITDENGIVLGLRGVDYNILFPHPHGLGMIPPIASINAALELLSPDFIAKPYAHGPLMAVIENEAASSFFLSYFPNYDEITGALQKIYKGLEVPLTADELPQDYHAVTIVGPAECTTMTVVYALPVELTGADGTLLAEAKWVSLQWNRPDGEPNLLLYGSGNLNLEGGFHLPGDLSDLLTAIEPLLNFLPSS